MRTIDTAPAGFTEFLRGGREKNADDLVAGLLNKYLDDRHVLLRGVTLPGGEKLGFVLLGPEGVWHLELLHLASLVNNGGVWHSEQRATNDRNTLRPSISRAESAAS